ncbi:hypothetical protein NSA56_01985 [Oceanobacillus caeni]|uniref:hypothetical protein n=1 Tax=Oceanobacillus caeni TaxID=405946 RepID=UPI002149E1EA|nr:hypothetical protein [Oceanobacillus caeni]MCR1833167.1 hypothetical protein [Oceanobacillus caeni]
MEANYRKIAEVLILDVLSDYMSAIRDAEYDRDAEHRKDIIITRLASLNRYEDFPIEEIIMVAEKRNNIFSFLSNSIDTVELKELISKRLDGEW